MDDAGRYHAATQLLAAAQAELPADAFAALALVAAALWAVDRARTEASSKRAQPHPISVERTEPRPDSTDRDGYTVREFAARWGVSTRTVDRAIARGEIRTTRIGRSVRIPAKEVRRMLG